jgi:hypothetical protein
MAQNEEKPVYLPTTAALALERQLDEEKLSKEELAKKYHVEGRDFTGDGNETGAFVGVSPEYRNYAGVFGQPFYAEDGPTAELEDRLTEGGAVAVSVEPESNQTEGGGSTVPLVYAEMSGEDFTNREVTVDEAKKEADRLSPSGDSSVPVKEADKTATSTTKATASKTAASGKQN